MNSKNLFYIKGIEIKHPMYSKNYLGNSVELIGSISDFILDKHFAENNTKDKGVEIKPYYNIKTNDVSIRTMWVYITEYREATTEEIEKFDKEFAKYNLVLERRSYDTICYPFFEKPFAKTHENILSTYYISKDNMQIVIGDITTTFKELSEKGFCGGDNIVLSGDNGYSHCWSKTTSAENVFKYIDCLFEQESLEKGYNENSKSLKGFAKSMEHWGYNFTNKGQLKLRITKSSFSESVVSFS